MQDTVYTGVYELVERERVRETHQVFMERERVRMIHQVFMERERERR